MLMPYPICMMRLSPALISLPLCCRIFCLTVTGCALNYRGSKNRLSDMDWNTCRQNLANWADKGALQLNKLNPALKEHPKAKHNDAYTNKIVEGLRSELYDLLALAEEFMSDLM